MPRPSEFADFATDTNFTNGPDVGTPTKVTPSGGELAEGNIRLSAPSAQKMNWWQNVVGRWVRWLAEISTQKEDVFTASGTWTCPANVTKIDLDGYGNGGGGGGGADSVAGGTGVANGGGGGGGSLRRVITVNVTPGVTYAVTIPAAASGGTSGNPGANGDDVTFGTIATFPGAAGGQAGTYVASSGTSHGGDSIASDHPGTGESAGGASVITSGAAASQPGHRARSGQYGGTYGANGGNVTNGKGGAAGSGGGGGHRGTGGSGGGGGGGASTTFGGSFAAGGNGGIQVSAVDGGTAGSAGSLGTSGVVTPSETGGAGGAGGNANGNSGAGGGGGGGAGTGETNGNFGGIGGSGARGRLVVRYRGDQAVVT